MYAIIATGGKQYRVSEGDVIYIEKIDAQVDSTVSFDVLLMGNDGDVKIGTPVVEGVKVEGKVVGQIRGEKIVVYKYKSKKNYRRKQGHRQPYTKVELTKIVQEMTTITVYTSADGAVRGFLASGHAGGKKIRGYDLVCCAVSALTQTGVNALEAVAKVTPVVAVRDGYLRCELPQAIDAGRMEKAQIVLQTVMTGLTDIQKIYPNLIRIQQEEWRQADAYDESSALRS